MEQEITSIIGNYGFPIAAFLLMWYTHNSSLKKLTVAISDLKTCIKSKK